MKLWIITFFLNIALKYDKLMMIFQTVRWYLFKEIMETYNTGSWMIRSRANLTHDT